jgi:hypothetical protein
MKIKSTSIIVLLSISSILLSCGPNPTKIMAKELDKVYIGMPVSEFKEKIEKEELIVMNMQVTIYRIYIKTYNDAHVALSGNGWRDDVRFFYFEDNKLVKIDSGERAVDYRIRID